MSFKIWSIIIFIYFVSTVVLINHVNWRFNQPCNNNLVILAFFLDFPHKL